MTERRDFQEPPSTEPSALWAVVIATLLGIGLALGPSSSLHALSRWWNGALVTNIQQPPTGSDVTDR